MAMSENRCPSDEELAAFQNGVLATTALNAVGAHLETCLRCQAALEKLDGCADSVVAGLRRHPPAPEAPWQLPAEGGEATPARTIVPGPSGAPAWPDLPGYDILGILSHGGMGVVYRARQLGANRLVALKMIRALEHANPTDRLRFQIETEAVARLQHPHIVQLYEVGEVRGQPFFSLEFCDGGTLAEELKKKFPTPREAAELIETLARAIHYAHLRGVVHRDLKPSNVLLAGAKRLPKITDFGLAKRIDAEAREISQSGVVMGTAAYMAPEQAAGKVRDTGPAADVYALGVLLYECLTGRPPFKGENIVQTLEQVRSQEPVPPARLQPKVPRDLDTVCLKCLRKEPERRYASAEELADDLRRFQAGEPIRARPVGALERAAKWAKRRPALAGLLGVTLLALIALVVLSTNLVVAQRDAENRRLEADKQADRAIKARDFLVSIFQLGEKDAKGGNTTVREILETAEQRIPAEFVEQPELGRDLVSALDKVKRGVGRRTPQAMLLEVRGAVQLQSAAGEPRLAVPQALVHLDDRLTLSADARVQLVILADLHKERLRPGRAVTIDFHGCVPADAVLERDNSVLMTFVRLPKGTFSMGWNGLEGSARKTEIKEDFEIAVHDVTQGQWQAIVGNNPSSFSRKGNNRNSVVDVSDEELKLFPVEMVSWEDAQEFIEKLNEQERGRGYSYRLPSSAEWEYACRGGATSEDECSYHYYFARPTNDLSSEQANFNSVFPFDRTPKGKYLARPTRVGAYPPNRLGLCDMHGNVWQMCDDLLAEKPFRVRRGGSWADSGGACRASFRYGYAPTAPQDCIGFRLARVPVR
jgi:formylglycine-generating enzyme required for sulfatase activity